MELYNQYLIPGKFKTSEIAFVNCNQPILRKSLFYVQFNDGKSGFSNHNNGFFNDSNGDLKKLTSDFLRQSTIQPIEKEDFFLSSTENIIRNIQPATYYYSYIKVIDDKLNPQLNDKLLLFKYGTQISNIITNYLSKSKDSELKTSFILNLELKQGFPSYDKSYFTTRYCNIHNHNLDINSEIHFNNFNLNRYIRSEKLKNIFAK